MSLEWDENQTYTAIVFDNETIKAVATPRFEVGAKLFVAQLLKFTISATSVTLVGIIHYKREQRKYTSNNQEESSISGSMISAEETCVFPDSGSCTISSEDPDTVVTAHCVRTATSLA